MIYQTQATTYSAPSSLCEIKAMPNNMDRLSVEAPHELLPTAAGCIAFLLFLTYIFSRRSKPATQQRMPPGPKPKPLIGNLLDMPPPGARIDEYWTRHRELHGPISSLTVFGTNLVIINDAHVAKEILEKRSAKYAARPVLNMAGGLIGLENGIILTQPGHRFREMRKISHNQLGSMASVSRWSQEISTEVNRYLLRVLDKPDEFRQHIRKEATSIVLKILYGYQVNPHGDDALVDIAERVMRDFAEAVVPGTYLVDTIPALAYVPDWFPGAGFKKHARECRERLEKMTFSPYKFAKRRFEEGTALTSVLSESLARLKSPATAEDDDIISWALFGLYAGGSDTTIGFMEAFYLAMLLYPDVQRKAQQEFDAVIGSDRLPDETDRARLPYISALLKECFRWEPIAEVIMPHAATEDDTYDSYLIPKGSMILPHLYGFYHDPAVYADPMAFEPERHLGPTPELDPTETIWGYGRRVCPGRHLALANLWIAVARTLAVFDIKPVPGQPPVRDFTIGAVRRPKHFVADVRVRSAPHERLIRAVEDEFPMPATGDCCIE